MSWAVQDLADAWLGLLAADTGLTSYDGIVPNTPAAFYVLSYLYIETPDGVVAADAVPLSFDSDVITVYAYAHCVSTTPAGARGVSGRVRNAVINKVPTAPNRTCHPIRFDSAQPPRRNEELPGAAVFDQTDIYWWRSLPG